MKIPSRTFLLGALLLAVCVAVVAASPQEKKQPAKKPGGKPPASTSPLTKKHQDPTIHIYASPDCAVVQPLVHAPPKSQGGTVTFVADSPTTITFLDRGVFAETSVDLDAGHLTKQLAVNTEKGQTKFRIKNCQARTWKPPEGGKIIMTTGDPNEIIIP